MVNFWFCHYPIIDVFHYYAGEEGGFNKARGFGKLSLKRMMGGGYLDFQSITHQSLKKTFDPFNFQCILFHVCLEMHVNFNNFGLKY